MAVSGLAGWAFIADFRIKKGWLHTETAQDMAYEMKVVRMDRAIKELTHAPKRIGPAFSKPDVSEGREALRTFL